MGVLTRFLNKFRPKLSEQDRAAVQSLKSMRTLKVVKGVNGSCMSIEYSDVEQEMRQLHQHTQQLFKK